MTPKQPTGEFIQLISSHQSRLYAYILTLLGDRQQAMDVMQETNLILWQKHDQFRIGTNFRAWMLQVAHYQVLSHRRNFRKREVFLDDGFLEEVAAEAATATIDLEERQALLRKCLEKLPDRQKDIVSRRYSEGASIKGVAKQLGTAASAIKQTLFRARASLIDCVQLQLKGETL